MEGHVHPAPMSNVCIPESQCGGSGLNNPARTNNAYPLSDLLDARMAHSYAKKPLLAPVHSAARNGNEEYGSIYHNAHINFTRHHSMAPHESNTFANDTTR